MMVFNPIQSINEVYFGKTKEIQAIEDAIDHFRNKHMGQYMVMKINQDPELIEISKMFEKQFGFGIFSLNIDNDMIVNSYTTPIDYRIDVNSMKTNDRLLADKSTFKFNSDLDYCCMVYISSGLIFNNAFATEEVMAVIMHEIGHNFYSSLDKKNGILASMATSMLFIEIMNGNIQILVQQSNTINSIVEKSIRNLRERGSILMDISDIITHTLNIMYMVKRIPMVLLNILSFNMLTAMRMIMRILKKLMNPLNFVLLPMKHGNERLADNFATMYGYGPALSSALAKMESYNANPSKIIQGINKIPYLSTLYNMVPLPAQIIATAFDEHPQGISRAKDQLDMLERELEKADIDPRMKENIQGDIDVINKQIDAFIDTSKGMKDPDLAKHIYNRVLYKITGDKSIKDILLDDRHKFERYDKTFYKSLDRK